MYFFIKHTLHLFLASVLLVSLSLIVSRLFPPSPQFKTLEMLHLSDCKLPCWVGIIPGKTTFGEARMLIEQTYLPENFEITLGHNPDAGTDWLRVKNPQDNDAFSVTFNEWQAAKDQTDNTVISQITFSHPLVTIGEWFFVLGKPQALSITWGKHYAVPNLLYDRQKVRVSISGTNNFVVDNPRTLTWKLDIYDQIEWDKTYLNQNKLIWHGFTRTDLTVLMQP
jgi:hypothetical protein